MANISDLFVDQLYGMACQELPQDVLEQAKLCLLDYMGCALAGSRLMAKRNQCFLDDVKKQGGLSSVIGFEQKTTLQNAAFLNAMSTHSTELDDGHRFGMIHLGASIFSALLPVAELEDIACSNVLKGAVIGYETAVRIAKAMQPSHKVRGYHTSGTCGTLGSAMAIATAMHFSRVEMKSALSAAAASAAGLLEMQEDDSELKPYNLAHAAVAGVMAAYTAKAGFVGPSDPMGGRRGMLAVMSEKTNAEFLTDFTSDCFEIERIYRKPYAACRHCHPAIEAALRIKNEHHLHPDDITSVFVETYKLAVGGHDHKTVQGVASAKLSIPFSVALALMKDKASLDDFSLENTLDTNILSLCQKIDVVANEMLTSWSPQKRAAIVHIITKNGEKHSCEVDYPKGEPENPMSRKDVEDKYRELTKGLKINNFYRQYGL